MSAVKKESLTVVTDASGDATAYTGVLTGRLLAIRFVKPGAGGYDTTADFTITTDRDGQALLTVSNVTASTTWHPRQPTHDTSGVASLYAAGGEPVESDIPIFQDRVKIVVAQGGNTLSGTFHVWVG